MPIKLTDFPATDGDYAQAFVDAIAAAGAQGAGIIELPGGDVHSSQEIVLPKGITLKGEGPSRTRLIGAALSGAVVRVAGAFCAIKDMTIDATPERTAGGALGGFGIRQEAEDLPGRDARFCEFWNLEIQNQPRHGIIQIGGVLGTLIGRSLVQKNGGHGIMINNGAATGRSNISRPGGIRIIDTAIQDNYGHSIKAGQAGEGIHGSAYRIIIDNVDTFRNAIEPGIRSHNSGMHLFGENMLVVNSALCGFAGIGATDPLTGGVYVAGRGIKLINNRYIEVVGQAVQVGNLSDLTTQDVEIDGVLVSNNTAGSLNPAVRSDSGARGIRARTHTKAFITRLLDANAIQFYSDFGGMIDTDQTVLA